MNTRALAVLLTAVALSTGCTAATTAAVADPAAVACTDITHAAEDATAAIRAHTDATAAGTGTLDATGLTDSSGTATGAAAAAALKRLAATTARPPMDGALGAAIEQLGIHATQARGAFIYPTRPAERAKLTAEFDIAKYKALAMCKRTSR
ncbi:MAG: hypothetical protein NTV19_01720 [Burkholderiales bacterium]|nr:hypothetical protein [Burkholderiales bacterium]